MYNKGIYGNINHMERLIRGQKIVRRIGRQGGDAYAANGDQDVQYKNSQMLIDAVPSKASFGAMYDKWHARLSNAFRALGDRIIERAANTDVCYVAALVIAITLLSVVLQPNGAIIAHTFQPTVFRLPQIEVGNLTIYASSQAIEAPVEDVDSENFRTFRTRNYIVQSGQTLSELANLHRVSMSTLVSFNQISNARSLQAGSIYSVPDREGLLHAVKGGETIEQIAERYEVGTNKLLDVNNLVSASLASGQELFVPGAVLGDFDLRLALGELFARPSYGRISSGFGYRPDPFTGVRRFHYGLDIASGKGTAVLAAMEGTVSYIGEQSRGYGKYIILRHPGGFQSLYAHLNGFNVRSGQYISRGRTIGWVGNTGRSTGAHLHFSIIKNGKYVSPVNYLY